MALQVDAKLKVIELAIAKCSGPGIESITTVSNRLSSELAAIMLTWKQNRRYGEEAFEQS